MVHGNTIHLIFIIIYFASMLISYNQCTSWNASMNDSNVASQTSIIKSTGTKGHDLSSTLLYPVPADSNQQNDTWSSVPDLRILVPPIASASPAPVPPIPVPSGAVVSGQASSLMLYEYGYDMHQNELFLYPPFTGIVGSKRFFGYRKGPVYFFGIYLDVPPWFGFGLFRSGIGVNVVADLIAAVVQTEGRGVANSGLKNFSPSLL